MTANASGSGERTAMPVWARKAIWVGVIIAALVVAYFVLASFVPRWWAHRVGDMSSGSFTRGITWGLVCGVLSTAVPLLLFYVAWRARHRTHARVWVIGSLVLGVIVAIPNLATLTVVLGNSSAAHAAQRTMDVEAPGFRGATLWGAIIGAVLFAAAVFFQRRYRRRGEELTRLRNDLHQREPRSPGESPAPEM